MVIPSMVMWWYTLSFKIGMHSLQDTHSHHIRFKSSYRTHETITTTEPLIAKLTWLNTTHSGWKTWKGLTFAEGSPGREWVQRDEQQVNPCRASPATHRTPLPYHTLSYPPHYSITCTSISITTIMSCVQFSWKVSLAEAYP